MILKIVLLLIILKVITQAAFEKLNRSYLAKHAKKLPKEFKGVMDGKTFKKSVEYTRAKSVFATIQLVYDAVVLIVVLASPLLPAVFELSDSILGTSVWSRAAYLFIVSILLSIPGMPFDWYSHFRLEERFGFNKLTIKLWIIDKVKILLISIIIGMPVLALVLKLVDWSGQSWWLWGFAVVVVFQLILHFLYPRLIMPLFNKFTPLKNGALKKRLFKLAKDTGFGASEIYVMDGSKRSGHSNAFFTGFGRYRRIVLFDTLIDQLNNSELASVLAHEIGHYKKGHILKMLALSVLMMFLAFYLISRLAISDSFYQAFGFSGQEGQELAPAMLLFSLVSSTVTYWLSPLFTRLSRIHEFQADAFAKKAVGSGRYLISSLKVLMKKNLGNLLPHPLYSAFYYSHPTLRERELALKRK